MRVHQLALAGLLSVGCTNSFAPEFPGRTSGFAPEFPGQLLVGGGNSVLDMAGSYLDHLGKPSFSSSEASPASPKKSYMYTKKPTQAKSGGQPKSGVSSGTYLDKMGSKPKPRGGFMYKGVPKTGAASKPGVSPGNYLDNMSSGASFTAGASISPPAAAAPVNAVPPPPVSPEPEPKPIAPAGEAAWAVTNPSSYLDALGAGSSGALKRSGGYMYKPKTSGGRKGPTGYLDNVGGSVKSSSGPRGYLENIGGASSGGKRQGGYMYKPSGTGQKKSSIGSYLDNVGSSSNVPSGASDPLAPAQLEAVATSVPEYPNEAALGTASNTGAPTAFEVPTLPGPPGGLNPLSGTIDRPTAGWTPVPRPGGGTPSPPNPYSGQGDRPSWNENPVPREINGPMSPPNALSASAERLSVISAAQNPAEREINGPMSPPNDLSAAAERPSAIAAGPVPREITGPMSPPNALSGQGEYPLAYGAGASSKPAATAASGPKGYLDSMGGSSGGKRRGGYMYKPSMTGQKKSSVGSYLDSMGGASFSKGAPATYEVPNLPVAPGGLNPLSGTIDRPTAGWKPVPRPSGGTPSPPNPYSGQGDRPSWNENPVQREISGLISPPNALGAGGPRPSEMSATPYAESAGGPGKPQVGLNNVLNMGGSSASSYVSSTNPWLSKGQPVAVGGAPTPPSLEGRPIAATAQPSAAFREPAPSMPAQSGLELPRPSAPPNAGGLDNRLNMDSAYPSPNSGVAPMQNPSWKGQVEEKAPPISAVAALTKNQPDFMDAFGTGTRASLQANPLSASPSSSKLGDQPSFFVQADGQSS